ncbi:MAG TPA: hypothetical protein VNK04_17710 [Gemmataceae bacterium]|nr:hypothetical protein [Gemmataceae bacterium]
MGATGWTYFVPYQKDPERALQDLRKDVFARRAYTLPGDVLSGLSDPAIAAAMPSPADLQKLLNISKALDQAMKGLGADTAQAEQDTAGVEKFLRDMQQQGPAKAARKAVAAKGKRQPKSIDQARELAAESGTHSILDIERTAPTRGFGLATALSGEELRALFGTEKPTRELVRRKEQEGALFSMRGRWEAAYFTVYDGDVPVELVFCGCSGD